MRKLTNITALMKYPMWNKCINSKRTILVHLLILVAIEKQYNYNTLVLLLLFA